MLRNKLYWNVYSAEQRILNEVLSITAQEWANSSTSGLSKSTSSYEPL